MGAQYPLRTLFCISLTFFYSQEYFHCHAKTLDKKELKEQVVEMFNHAYDSYMTYAYPADELMPLSCKGRVRGEETSRGDIDDALGRFSLTLIDTLDTLAVLGELDKFEEAVRLVIKDVSFDTDIVVSVFETNIRVLGGLLGGHVMALALKEQTNKMQWYNDELLSMAKDMGYRLLPAFNTSTGMPYPRVNLKYGIHNAKSRTGTERDTCTACAGTMILEFAALSRLTGITIFEEKAHRAMQYIWGKRHRSNNLVGTTINIHNGDWVRRESGVGAGIDSYYEYCLKAYILLGEEIYLDRFNKHYDAIMRYVSNGPLLIDVHMHKPLTKSKNFMDALLAFWPGLQVLVGDIKPAMETHEMLYQVTKKHKFLPEAFTVDHNVYWGQHPLRPEFVESTFFLYKATGDPYYLEVGKNIMDNLNHHARVPCGFAGMKDVRTGSHEDRMDSFVLAETFKYLYLLFAETDDLIIELDDYIFTTEAHLLPLYIGNMRNKTAAAKNVEAPPEVLEYTMNYDRTCPNHNYKQSIAQFAELIRTPMPPQTSADQVCSQSHRPTFNMPKKVFQKEGTLRAVDFIPGNREHEMLLKKMGIRLVTMRDGRVQLLHTASQAATPEDAEEGMIFMQEMIELSKVQSQEEYQPRAVQLISSPYLGSIVLTAGPAQFGMELHGHFGVYGEAVVADPFRACAEVNNAEEFVGRIVIMERGDCMFIDKVRNIQKLGAIGAIIIDNNEGSSSDMSPIFAMSGDGSSDVTLAAIFLFWKEGKILLDTVSDQDGYLEVMLVDKAKSIDDILKQKQADMESESGTPEDTTGSGEGKETTLGFGSSKTSGPEVRDDLVDAIMNEVQRMVGGEGGIEEYIRQLEETQRDLRLSKFNLDVEVQYGDDDRERTSEPGTLEVGVDLSQQSGDNQVWQDLQKLRKYLKETVRVEEVPDGGDQKALEEGAEIRGQAPGVGLQAPPEPGVEEMEGVDERQTGSPQQMQHTVQPTPAPKMHGGVQPQQVSVEQQMPQPHPHVQVQHESQVRRQQQQQQHGQTQQHPQPPETPPGASSEPDQLDAAQQQQLRQAQEQREQQLLQQQHIQQQRQQQQEHDSGPQSQQPQPQQETQFKDPQAKQETLETRQREWELQEQLAQEQRLKLHQQRQEELQQQVQKNLARQKEKQHPHLQVQNNKEEKDEL